MIRQSPPAARIVAADAEGIEAAAALLRRGEVCAFPTETVYGLGASAYSAGAVAAVYRMKGRPAWNPLIVHAASARSARSLARTWPDAAARLAERFWPGPLTLVVDRDPDLPWQVQPGMRTVAIRVPGHPVALRLLEACALPVAAPSANRSEGISPTSPEHVARGLPDVPLILDGGAASFGIESTVVDVTADPPRLLRPGAISVRLIRDVIGPVALPGSASPGSASPGVVTSPGTGRRHYAPSATLVLLDELTAGSISRLPRPLGILSHVAPDEAIAAAADHVETLAPDSGAYAAELYAALHRLDAAGVVTIAALLPPHEEDWLAVSDRLTRASAT